MPLARKAVILYISVFQGDVQDIGIWGDRVGQRRIIPEPGCILAVDLINMHQLKPEVGIFFVYIQDAVPDLEDITGHSAKPVCKKSNPPFRVHGLITNVIEPARFL